MESIWTQRRKTEEGNGWQESRSANGPKVPVRLKNGDVGVIRQQAGRQEVVTRKQGSLVGDHQMMARSKV